MTTAWMIHRNGNAYPVKVHPYVENYDGDLYNAADVASFILFNTKETEFKSECIEILVAWMLQLVEESEDYEPEWNDITSLKDIAYEEIKNLDQTEFLYLDVSNPDKYIKFLNGLDLVGINKYSDYATQEYLVTQLIQYINQQFCRVRYGGEFDTKVSNNSIWFRISSIGFNWRDIIYMFVADNKNKYKIATINIGRDAESDNMINNTFGKRTEYFYKASDGTVYQNMPIDEYLSEEHETNPVFASSRARVGNRYKFSVLTKMELRVGWSNEVCNNCIKVK